MCVKTKTEWSCGCYKKALSTCDEAPNSRTPCPKIDKYRYLFEGDCNACRAGGANITRGADGYGRHAREIASREKKLKQHTHPRAVLGEITGNGSQAGSDKPAKTPLVTPDPWMKSTRREKEWESPHRRHADEEWEREHAHRKEDIESLAQSHSNSPTPIQRRSSRRTVDDHEHEHDRGYDHEIEDSLVGHHQRRNSGSLQQQSPQDKAHLRSMRPTRPKGSRHGSFESVESVGTMSRGRSRTTPFQYGYATDFGYAVENRVPRDAYEAVGHRRR
jgi:hypothetical protein